jgi:hypothetical protein
MDPLSLFGKGGNGKNILNPGLPYIVGENPAPILKEEKGPVETGEISGKVETGEISGNRAAEIAIFQVEGSEPCLINGFSSVHIVSPLHELKDSRIAHQFDLGLGIAPPNGPESGEAEDEESSTKLWKSLLISYYRINVSILKFGKFSTLPKN